MESDSSGRRCGFAGNGVVGRITYFDVKAIDVVSLIEQNTRAGIVEGLDREQIGAHGAGIVCGIGCDIAPGYQGRVAGGENLPHRDAIGILVLDDARCRGVARRVQAVQADGVDVVAAFGERDGCTTVLERDSVDGARSDGRAAKLQDVAARSHIERAAGRLGVGQGDIATQRRDADVARRRLVQDIRALGEVAAGGANINGAGATGLDVILETGAATDKSALDVDVAAGGADFLGQRQIGGRRQGDVAAAGGQLAWGV